MTNGIGYTVIGINIKDGELYCAVASSINDVRFYHIKDFNMGNENELKKILIDNDVAVAVISNCYSRYKNAFKMMSKNYSTYVGIEFLCKKLNIDYIVNVVRKYTDEDISYFPFLEGRSKYEIEAFMLINDFLLFYEELE